MRARSEEDALVLIHSNMVDPILQLLQSASYDMRSQLIGPSSAILRTMASHSRSTRASVIEPLEALLHDSEVKDVEFWSDFLSEIADSQASAFVKRNRGIPLSPETLEIYWSYVSWKYVSTLTKIKILKELETRTRSEKDVLVLIHSKMVDTILQLPQSASHYMHSQLTGLLAAILSNVASHSKSSSAAVNEPLVALLRDGDVNNVMLGFNFLCRITDSLAGAEGVVVANALDYLLDGLGSPSPEVRKEA
ncbi:hypothetical protein FB451DRAFT_451497 [Mycena latifolia]|nr:hypothetical protein FB451DRAFT_451497 [Mycena latifolia]